MTMRNRQEEALHERLVAIAVVFALVFVGFWFWFWLYPGYEVGYTNPNVNHPKALATVARLGPVQGTDAASAFRQVKLSYKNFYGRTGTSTILMPYSAASRVGQRELMIANRDGSVWFYNDWTEAPDGTRVRGDNPRDGHQHPSKAALIVFPVWMFLAWMVGVMGYGLLLAIDWLCDDVLKGLPGRLIKLAGLGLGKIGDEVKLRWEFFRRRKRVRPSPAYKMVRRFMAELARMDPVPPVLEARRQANRLLTQVLVRDNQPRVEEITGMIEAIRDDVRLDIKARQLAHEELAGQL